MLRIVVLTFVFCAHSVLALAAPPSFKLLGDHPNQQDASYATAVSDDGTVVVGWSAAYRGQAAFRWSQARGFVEYEPSEGGPNYEATDVSADGEYWTGSMRYLDGSVSPFIGVSYDYIGTLGINGRGFGISDDGNRITGTLNSRNGEIAFLWKSGLGPSVLGSRAGETNSSASDISGDGNFIVGYLRNSERKVAMRWNEATGYEILTGPAGETIPAEASATSVDGSVVVGALTDGSAFRWTQATGMQALLEGATNEIVHAAARDVSADGSMVVGGSEVYGAFIWDEVHGARLLRDVLVDRYGLADELGEFRPLIATGISADGKVIVGAGDFNGVTRGFVATIPEPSTYVLATIGFTVFVLQLQLRRPQATA
jgi:probable HAF family extracellular repeat protein